MQFPPIWPLFLPLLCAHVLFGVTVPSHLDAVRNALSAANHVRPFWASAQGRAIHSALEHDYRQRMGLIAQRAHLQQQREKEAQEKWRHNGANAMLGLRELTLQDQRNPLVLHKTLHSHQMAQQQIDPKDKLPLENIPMEHVKRVDEEMEKVPETIVEGKQLAPMENEINNKEHEEGENMEIDGENDGKAGKEEHKMDIDTAPTPAEEGKPVEVPKTEQAPKLPEMPKEVEMPKEGEMPKMELSPKRKVEELLHRKGKGRVLSTRDLTELHKQGRKRYYQTEGNQLEAEVEAVFGKRRRMFFELGTGEEEQEPGKKAEEEEEEEEAVHEMDEGERQLLERLSKQDRNNGTGLHTAKSAERLDKLAEEFAEKLRNSQKQLPERSTEQRCQEVYVARIASNSESGEGRSGGGGAAAKGPMMREEQLKAEAIRLILARSFCSEFHKAAQQPEHWPNGGQAMAGPAEGMHPMFQQMLRGHSQPMELEGEFSDFAYTIHIHRAFHFMRSLFPAPAFDVEQLILFLVDSGVKAIDNEAGSGANIFVTRDRRLFIKQLDAGEREFFQADRDGFKGAVWDYVEYLHARKQHGKHSFLPKYYAMFEIKHRGKSEAYIVMGSVFPAGFGPDYVFDLKGACINRRQWRNERTQDPAGMTLRDLDLFRYAKGDEFGTQVEGLFHKGLVLSEHNHAAVKEILHADSQFLSKLRIMDYSLLLGVRFMDETAAPKDNRVQHAFSKWTTFNAACNQCRDPRSGHFKNGQKVLLSMGVIDVLQQFRLKKRVEQLWKSTKKPTDGFLFPPDLRQKYLHSSVQQPDKYAERLVAAVSGVILHGGKKEEDLTHKFWEMELEHMWSRKQSKMERRNSIG